MTPVACPGLADAVDAGDEDATAAAVAAAAAQTPAGCEAIVLGCTEYELAAGQISQAVPGAVTFGSAGAVAAQALRRIPPMRAGPPSELPVAGARRCTVQVLLSGRPAELPPAALRYPEGRLLASLVVLAEDREPMAGSAAQPCGRVELASPAVGSAARPHGRVQLPALRPADLPSDPVPPGRPAPGRDDAPGRLAGLRPALCPGRAPSPRFRLDRGAALTAVGVGA